MKRELKPERQGERKSKTSEWMKENERKPITKHVFTAHSKFSINHWSSAGIQMHTHIHNSHIHTQCKTSEKKITWKSGMPLNFDEKCERPIQKAFAFNSSVAMASTKCITCHGLKLIMVSKKEENTQPNIPYAFGTFEAISYLFLNFCSYLLSFKDFKWNISIRYGLA